MSNTTSINFKGTDGDAQGHGIRKNGLDDCARKPGDDTEGHWKRTPSDDVTDDAEGHGRKPPSDDAVEDAEGHGSRRPGIDDGSGADDAEGHVWKRP